MNTIVRIFWQRSTRLREGCLVAVFLGTLALPGSEWPSDMELVAAYRDRCEETIEQMVAATDPENLERGSLFTIAANLAAGENLDWVRQRLRTVNDPPSGAMFWMHPMILTMLVGQDVLRAEDMAFCRDLWRTYYPYRGDTENHWLMYYVSLYLVCEMYPDAGSDAWYNGKSSAENMAEAKDYIQDWIRITTAYGQGEYDSPNYIEEYTRPLALLAGWAQDAELKEQGRMMLDYVLLDYAVENLNGLYGGAHSRLYPRYTLQPALTAAAAHGWLLFGQGNYRSNAGNLIIALSGYTPPPILYRIAHDRETAYAHRELKRTRWLLRHAGPEAFQIDFRTTTPVYKYSYVHPDYILGSSQGGLLQPIQQQTWSLLWREDDPTGKANTMFGLQPYSNPLEGTMYFAEYWDTVTDLIARSKVDYDSPDKLEGGSPHEQIFQHTSTLIALYDMPEGNRFPHIQTVFSRDLEARVDDSSGWIFAQGGPLYLAYRPLVPGEWRPVDWTGLLKGGAGGWFSTNFEEIAAGCEFYVSESLKNGYILEVAPRSEFVSYEAFQETIRSLPLKIALRPTPTVEFTTREGVRLEATYGKAPVINDATVDYSSWPLFDGPFAAAARASERLEIRHGNQRYTLDFENLRTTLKTEVK